MSFVSNKMDISRNFVVYAHLISNRHSRIRRSFQQNDGLFETKINIRMMQWFNSQHLESLQMKEDSRLVQNTLCTSNICFLSEPITRYWWRISRNMCHPGSTLSMPTSTHHSQSFILRASRTICHSRHNISASKIWQMVVPEKQIEKNTQLPWLLSLIRRPRQ